MGWGLEGAGGFPALATHDIESARQEHKKKNVANNGSGASYRDDVPVSLFVASESQ